TQKSSYQSTYLVFSCYRPYIIIIGEHISKFTYLYFATSFYITHHTFRPFESSCISTPIIESSSKQDSYQSTYLFMPSFDMPSVKAVIKLTRCKTSNNS